MGNSADKNPLRLVTAMSLCGLTFAATAVVVVAAPPAQKKATAPANKVPATTQPGFTDNTPLTVDQKILHLLNRAEFGPRPGDFERVKQIGINAWIDQQLHPDTINDSTVDSELASFTALQKPTAELGRDYFDGLKRNQQIQKLVLAAQEQQKQAPAAADGGAMMDNTPAPPLPNLPGGGNAQQNMALYRSMTPEQRDQLTQLIRDGRRGLLQDDTQLVVAKVVRAVESQRQLQEVMVDFWTNHFNIDIRKNACRTYKVSDDREVIRKYSLGKFRDLLEASAKSPAMLVYLDNAQSSGPQVANPRREQVLAMYQRQLEQQAEQGNEEAKTRLDLLKRRPKPGAAGLNENYAREIMELHTLGVDGGYTQKDVTEVARCLTGWTINRQGYFAAGPAARPGVLRNNGGGAMMDGESAGGFQFDPRRHDNGQKVVLGHVIPAGGGIQDGETVLDILSSHPSTMKHVSYQLCQRFVCDEPPASLVEKCVATWKRTDGDIAQIVRTILTSNEFNSRVAYQQKIKSPFEFAVSAARALDASYVLPSPVELRPNNQGLALQPNATYTGGANARFLPGQVAVLGEPLFQCQPPTGYPEDSRKWVSSGALISRLNYALALTSGKLADVSLSNAPDVLQLQEASASPEQFVTHLTDVILHGEVSPATRATLLREASQMDGGQPGIRNVALVQGGGSSPLSTDPQMARKLTALVLGSPEFQRR